MGAAPSPPDPVDWSTARRIGRAIAGRDPISTSYLGASLTRDFAAVTAEAEHLVAEATGLRSPSAAVAGVIDRQGWVDANIASMRRMIGPLAASLAGRTSGTPFAGVGRQVTGSEMGVLLGYMAQRVLGQYELMFPGDPAADAASGPGGDAVHYVGPNVLALEKRFAFRPLEFRRWIALHELTHRAQFTGVPWMRPYFLGLVEDLLASVQPDPRMLLRAFGRLVESLASRRHPLDDGGLVALFASPEQRRTLDRVQALMTLLEGHGNWVMNDLGKRHVAGEERMARVLDARRHAGGVRGQLNKLLGLEMKLRQYEVGERFVGMVVAEAGPRAIDAAWRSPAHLPTLAELDQPRAWLTRVDGLVAAPA